MIMNKVFCILLIIVFPGIVAGQGKFFGGNGDGFATATISNQVLPLLIEDFEGHMEQNSIRLRFTIRSDEMLCGIVVEKSRGGSVFTRIDSILLYGSSYMPEIFSKLDNSVLPGNNYYRLRIVKCSDAFVYSKIIMVPAPMRNIFYYSSADQKLYYYLQKAGVLQVHNAQGQLMVNKMIQAGSGSLMLDIPASGLYFYQFAGMPAVKFIK